MNMLRVCAAAALMAWLAPLSHAAAADQVDLPRAARRARAVGASDDAAAGRTA